MSWITELFGGSAAGNIGDLAVGIREAIVGKELDPNKQLDLIAKAAETQNKVNEVEAAHRTVFVAGWRPFIGWICGVILLYSFLIRDLIVFAFPHLNDLPSPALEQIFTLLIGMLGLGGLRTYEKIQGKAR